MRPAAFLLVAALVATGGCGDRAEPADMSAKQVAEQLAGMRVEPGLWELTSEVVEVSAPGLPREVRNRMIGPRRQMRHCITPAQAERPEANFLAVRADSDCVYRRFTVEDGRMRGEMSCPDAQAQMDGRYGPEGYDLRMVMESPMPEGQVRMTLQIRARGQRIGACEGGSEG